MRRFVIIHGIWLLISLLIIWRMVGWVNDALPETINSGMRGNPFSRLALTAFVAAFLFTTQGWVALKLRNW